MALMAARQMRSEEHTSELQSRSDLVCRLLLEKKKNKKNNNSLINRNYAKNNARQLKLKNSEDLTRTDFRSSHGRPGPNANDSKLQRSMHGRDCANVYH